MITLGINAYHGDASSCIFENNELIAAAEEERFTRIKHSAGFPSNAVKFCLDFCEIKLSDVDYIVINRKPGQKILPKLIYASKNIFNQKFIINRLSNLKKITSIKEHLQSHFNENEPIVCNSNEALDCFLRTKMDILVLENYILQRQAMKVFYGRSIC